MQRTQDFPFERPIASRVLREAREAGRRMLDPVDPGLRMEAAFAISMDARKLHRAGLKAQGFSESEARAKEEKRFR